MSQGDGINGQVGGSLTSNGRAGVTGRNIVPLVSDGAGPISGGIKHRRRTFAYGGVCGTQAKEGRQLSRFKVVQNLAGGKRVIVNGNLIDISSELEIVVGRRIL